MIGVFDLQIKTLAAESMLGLIFERFKCLQTLESIEISFAGQWCSQIAKRNGNMK